ncbi:MAG TPA: arylsulfatase [Solibacterales bacterium]|nr:arylsulfatase [Bryobacterales bacterium]
MTRTTSRRDFLARSAAATLPLTLAAQRRTRPNVLILLTDDQGYGDFGCHGNPVLKTPNMDRLHSQSVRFTDFHAAPMCTPTRGQLLTGQDALRNGATSVTAGRAVVRKDIPMMPGIFAAAGYRTGIFGKWHLGDNYPYRPMDRGFERAVYHLGWGFSAAPEFDNDYFNGRYRDQGSLRRFSGYCADFWFDQAMDWMRGQRQPFLCYLPTNTPHTPAWVEEQYAAPYRKPGLPAEFFGMIANLDENLGRLERFLAASGLRDNTIVLLITDNGGTGGTRFYNAGLRARKMELYEGGHRAACFVRWPGGGFGSPRDVAVPAQMQDLLPTFLDLCGVAAPAGAAFDGRSLAPLLRGTAADIGDRMMVVQYGQIPRKWDSAVIWGKWRLVGGNELYDLASDPGQVKDVAMANPAIAARLRDHYEEWWSGVAPRLGEFAPISLGAPQENPVELTSSDWQDVYCDNAGHVSNAVGGPRGGPWAVSVERSGAYRISLSRWPPWQKLALNAARPPQAMTKGELPAGKALPIAGARLRVAGQDLSQPAAAGATTVEFVVRLEAGTRTNLHAWFQDAAGNDLAGAFYATVLRLGA